MKNLKQLLPIILFVVLSYFDGYGQNNNVSGELTVDNFTLNDDVVGTQFTANNGIVYEITDPSTDGGFGKVKIVNYSGSGENVIIPNVISIRLKRYNEEQDIFFNYSVLAIENQVFRNKGLHGSLKIGEGIRKIDDYAFQDNQLTEVIIGKNVTEIGAYAFHRNGLKVVNIPGSVTNIKERAFGYNNDLALMRMESNTPPTLGTRVFVNSNGNHRQMDLAVPNGAISAYQNSPNDWAQFGSIIPKFFTSSNTTYEIIETRPNKRVEIANYDIAGGSRVNISETVDDGSNTYEVTTIGDGAFKEKGLIEVTIPDGVIAIGDAAFQKNFLRSVVIPNSVISIGNRAFQLNQLTEVTLSNNLTSIEAHVFQNNRLRSVVIPNSVKSIRRLAFKGNTLTEVTLGENVTHIENNAFEDNQLRSVVIPNSVTHIGDLAFKNNQLTSVTLGENVTEIGDRAFRFNQIQGHLEIPNSVTHIGYTAFNFNQLTSVTIGNGGTIIDASAFADNQLTEVIFGENATLAGHSVFQNNQLTSVVIPNGLTRIPNWAFNNNQLESVTIPNSVTHIGISAFVNNLKLHIVQVEAITPPDIGASAFVEADGNIVVRDLRSEIHLIVPKEVIDAYKASDDWKVFKSISDSSTPPQPTIGNAPQDVDSIEPFTVNITFDGEVTGFELADIEVTNATVSTLTGSGPTYTATIVPTSLCGDITIDVPAGVATGVNSLPNLAATQVRVGTVDTIAPTITCPADVVANTADNGTGDCITTVDLGSPVTDDNCSVVSVVAQVNGADIDPNTYAFSTGTTTVTWIVRDGTGNTASCEQTVTVHDDEDPIAICQDITVQLDADGNKTITADEIDNGSYDNCGIQSLSIDKDTFDCSDIGVNILTLTVTDINGNIATCLTTVTVEEHSDNLEAIAKDITVQLNADGEATISPEDVDNGSRSVCNNTGPVSLSLDKDTFTCDDVGTPITVTLTATHGNNSDTMSALVTVEEYLGNVEAIAKNITAQLDADGEVTISPEDVDDGSSYGCGHTPSLSLDKNTFTCDDVGVPVTVTLTATHGNNSDTTTAVVTVEASGNCESGPIEDFTRGFSPNGDGIADTLVIEGLEHYKNNVVKIYDLSQRLLFSAHYRGPSDGWDGTYKGSMVPVGSYVCVIDYNEPGLSYEAKMIYVNY